MSADDSARGSRRVLALGVLLVAGLASWTNLHRSIWIDEAYSLDTARRTLAGTLHQALYFELQPPAYFLALNLWLRAHPTLEFGRFLSTIAVLAGLWVLSRIRPTEGYRAPVSLALFAALLPPVLWAASEARAYGLVFLLSSIATLLFIRMLAGERPPSRGLLAGYVAVWLACLLTHYYTGFLLAAQVIAGVCFGQRARWSFVAAACLIAVGLVPLVPTILRQAGEHPASLPLALEGGSVLARTWSRVIEGGNFTLEALFLASFIKRPWGLLVLGAGLGVLLVPSLRREDERSLRVSRALVLCVLFPLLVLLWLLFSRAAHAVPRYLIFILPGGLAFLGFRIDLLRSAGLARGVLLGWTGMLALCAASYLRNARSPEDWRGAATVITSRALPGQPVLVYAPDATLPLRYYYRGANPVFGVPRDPDLVHYTLERPTIASEEELRTRVMETGADHGEFWFVMRQRRNPGTRPDIERLDGFLDTTADLLEHDSLTGIDLYRYRSRSGAR